MNIFSAALVLCAITCVVTTNASDTTITQDAGLTLGQAIDATLDRNPQLAGYGFHLKALQGEQQTAALKPEFRVATELENVAGSGEFRGVGASEFTLSLSSAIESAERREARLGLVSARRQQLESSQRLLTLDVLAALTRRFIALVAAQEQLALQREAHQLAQETLTTLAQQVESGRLPEAEQLRARAAVARSRIELRKAEQQLGSERFNLAAFWAETAPDFSRAQADLLALAPALPLPELLARLDENPDVTLLAGEIQLRAAELRQAQSDGIATLDWQIGVRRLQATEDSALVAGISMPLGAGRRASGAIATATAKKAQAEQQRDSAYIQLQAQLASLYAAREQAVAEVDGLRSEVLPPLRQAMAATADAFSQGRYSYLELNLARRELLDAQQALIAAAARAHVLTADMERLTGTRVTR